MAYVCSSTSGLLVGEAVNTWSHDCCVLFCSAGMQQRTALNMAQQFGHSEVADMLAAAGGV